jgi:hypothetical protein
LLKLLVVMVVPALPVLVVASARAGIRIESRRLQRQNNLQPFQVGMQLFTHEPGAMFRARTQPQRTTVPGSTELGLPNII